MGTPDKGCNPITEQKVVCSSSLLCEKNREVGEGERPPGEVITLYSES